MAQVIFQPAGNAGSRDHYRDTVERPVPFERLGRFLDEETMSSLRRDLHVEAAPTWGVTPGRTGANERKWDRIAVGDVAVFLRDDRAYSSGVVAFKTRSRDLARELWGTDDNGQTWECMYFLDDVKPCDLSYEELNRAARYAAGNPFQGFIILGEDRAPAVLRLLGRDSSEQTVWWVNQGATYRQERPGGYVWAPTTDKRGSALAHHANVMRLKPGDALIHYADGRIRAVSRVVAAPTEASRPAELPEGAWQSTGYLGRLEYRDIAEAIPITAIPDEWRQEEAARPAPQPHPFNRDGGVA